MDLRRSDTGSDALFAVLGLLASSRIAQGIAIIVNVIPALLAIVVTAVALLGIAGIFGLILVSLPLAILFSLNTVLCWRKLKG